MVASKGWICLHRAMTDWEWYDDINVTRLFIHCLLRANHKPQKWRGIDIPRGSFITGRQSLAKETKLTEQQIRTALNKLISTSEITIKATNKNSLLTVVKYSDYQDSGEPSTSKTTSNPTSEQPTSNQQVTTNNNVNNENNEKKGAKAKPVNRFVKPSFSEAVAFATESKLKVDCQSFIDYYESNGWKVGGKTPMKNWQAAMRLWAKRSFDNTSNQKQGGIKADLSKLGDSQLLKLASQLGVNTRGKDRWALIDAIKVKQS
ncbi:MAG: hypothetical protein ACI9WC_003013 [Arenicella sp.]